MLQRYDRECEYLYGKLLIEEKNEVLQEFLRREYRLKSEVWDALKEQDTENAQRRKETLAREFALIRETEEQMRAQER